MSARAAVLAALLLAGACQQTLRLPPQWRGTGEPPAGAFELRREYWDRGPAPQRPRTELEGIVFPGGAFVRHGRDRAFFASGALAHERHWLHGEPTGTWRAWWEDGAERSRYEYASDGSASEMRFWHANGALEARGPAILGRRWGRWEFFRADGTRESTGDYADGKRDGPWLAWDECGELVSTEVYEQGVLVDRSPAARE